LGLKNKGLKIKKITCKYLISATNYFKLLNPN